MVFVYMGCYLAALLFPVGAGAEAPLAAQLLRASAAAGPRLLKLRRLKAHPLPDADAGAGTLEKSFYVGHVSVGGPRPQRFRVTFDTASGQIVLPSFRCQSPACVERRRYLPQVSTMGTDVNADGTAVQEGLRRADRRANRDSLSIGFSSLDLGDGRVQGELLREAVCLGAEGLEDEAARLSCAEVGMVAATTMTDVPFRAMPSDGAIGLGLKGLSISQPFNFLGQLAASSRGTPPTFGMYLGPSSGEISFGGVNPARLASPMSWLPVLRPEEGYWQVRVLRVRIGNTTVTDCERLGGCRGIVDSCASRLGVPAAFLPGFQAAARAGHIPGGAAKAGCAGPDMHIDLEGATLTLRSEDYLAGEACEAQLTSLQLPEEFAGAFLLGENVLRRHYAAFDAEKLRLGFALAAALPDDDGPDVELLPGAELWAGARVGEVMEEGVAPDTWLAAFLFHALAMQAVIVLLVSCTGGYVKCTQICMLRLTNVLARSGLLPRSSRFVAAEPLAEGPEGDECAICLGSREDTCCTGCAGKARPRWCRLCCGHQFHEECIFEWLWKVPSCPVCRCRILEPQRLKTAVFLAPDGRERPTAPIL